jgi:hypothetical protein
MIRFCMIIGLARIANPRQRGGFNDLNSAFSKSLTHHINTAQGSGAKGQGGYSIDNAVNFLNSHAYSPDGPNKYGTGSCSPFVPNAINAGFGDKRIQTNLAGSAYGPSLLKAGFTSVDIKSLAAYTPPLARICNPCL